MRETETEEGHPTGDDVPQGKDSSGCQALQGEAATGSVLTHMEGMPCACHVTCQDLVTIATASFAQLFVRARLPD